MFVNRWFFGAIIIFTEGLEQRHQKFGLFTLFAYTPPNFDMGVSKNRGIPKWMVYFMENPIKMDDLGGFPPIFGLTPT